MTHLYLSTTKSLDFVIITRSQRGYNTFSKNYKNNGENDIIYISQGKKKYLSLYKMMIVNNSLHTYCTLGKDERADAELMLFYKSDLAGSDYLLICVPIMFTSTSLFFNSRKDVMPNNGNSTVKKIINMTPIPSKSNKSTPILDININTLIPLNKPFFHQQYVTETVDNCFIINSKTIMIVFNVRDIHFLLDKYS